VAWKARIVGDRPSGALGHAEGGEGGVAGRLLAAEQLGVRGIGAGIAPLDVVDPQLRRARARSAACPSSEKVDARSSAPRRAALYRTGKAALWAFCAYHKPMTLSAISTPAIRTMTLSAR
jgi:hypothetical protein